MKENRTQEFEEFLKGRFGESLYKMYFQPYNEKVWRRDLTKVPLSWLEGKLPMPTVEEMIFNNIKRLRRRNLCIVLSFMPRIMVLNLLLTDLLKA